ncbi:class I SAM-dependent methyltransferase [Bacillus massiliglaciei]|uniref:class I SAM-dependent methyltransferase n=1 Tax=Bacillus massiliglaciei TaxID=1816693 RepID=UPI000A6C54BC|nr:class I SAM-dependent methyltransferase [Bacillus massiliglaciei]
MDKTYIETIRQIGSLLETANIPYHFTGAASLALQQVELQDYSEIKVSVQWDLFKEARQVFEEFLPSEAEEAPDRALFRFEADRIDVSVFCLYNTTIKTNPYRISVVSEGGEFWCLSLYSYLYEKEMAIFKRSIHQHLESLQKGLTAKNEQAWNQDNYLALLNRFGKPEELAEKIRANPWWRLHPFYKYLGSTDGKKITHLMGSNGVKAVSLAVLGAEVRVADFSRENAAFANELAEAAGVNLEYIVSDVLSLPENLLDGQQEIVLMELGVLHYMIDLAPLLNTVRSMLKPGGRFVLHEFHPISTKLITSTGKKHKVTGDYFSPELEKHSVAFSKHKPDDKRDSLSEVIQRKWTIGELVTWPGWFSH